jgi:hypothetical protein
MHSHLGIKVGRADVIDTVKQPRHHCLPPVHTTHTQHTRNVADVIHTARAAPPRPVAIRPNPKPETQKSDSNLQLLAPASPRRYAVAFLARARARALSETHSKTHTRPVAIMIGVRPGGEQHAAPAIEQGLPSMKEDDNLERETDVGENPLHQGRDVTCQPSRLSNCKLTSRVMYVSIDHKLTSRVMYVSISYKLTSRVMYCGLCSRATKVDTPCSIASNHARC